MPSAAAAAPPNASGMHHGTVSRQPTRRQVLAALGAALGSGAVASALTALDLVDEARPAPFRAPRPGDFSLQGRAAARSVLVLGAGMAGLCCAYELEKAGYAVTVVEARPEVGGRNRTVRRGTVSVDTRGERQEARFADGLWLNPGPARIAQHHTTLEYCRELGVPVEVFVNTNADAYVERDGVVRRRRSATADLEGYVGELLVKALGAGALDAELSRDERDGLVEHLRTVVGDPSRRGFVEPPGAAPGVPPPADSLRTLLGLRLSPELAFERDWHQATPMFHPVGGMDALPRALAAALRGPVLLGHQVLSLEDDGTTVAAVVRNASGGTVRLDADLGVLTLPPHLIARLPTPFGRDVRDALRRPQPVVTGKMGLEYADRFWESDDRIFGGATTTGRAARQIWYPSTGWLGEGGVVMGAYPFGAAAVEFSRRRHAAREELALEAGQAVHGERYRRSLRSSFSVDWATQPFAEGAWAQWDGYGAAYRLLQSPAGRWSFAGDWLSRTTGWQHGALESARHAVTVLHDRVLRDD